MIPVDTPPLLGNQYFEPPLRALAYFDILGIGDLMKVDYNSAADKIEQLLGIIADAAEDHLSLGAELRSFSDSVFLSMPMEATLDDSINDLKEFCCLISKIMSVSLPSEIPLSGAISIGKTRTVPRHRVLDSYYISCRAVWEVVRWESAQKWVGISFVPPRVVDEDNTTGLFYTRKDYYRNALNVLEHSNLVLKHRIPASGEMVRGKTTEAYALCWTRSSFDSLSNTLNGVLNQIDDDSIRPRYEATLKFIKYQIRKGVGP